MGTALACFLATALLKAGVYLCASTRRGGSSLEMAHDLRVACLECWMGVDTSPYLAIAGAGYSGISRVAHAAVKIPTTYAFFPGYPLALRLLWPPRACYTAAIVLSIGCLLAAALLLFELVDIDYGPAAARWCSVCLFAFPSAFVLSDAMSESLFLLLCIGCARQCRRGRWVSAAVLGLLASLTRPFGVLISVLIALERLEAGPRSRTTCVKTALLGAVPVGGILLYGLFNWVKTRDFFAFAHVQARFQRHLSDPFSPMFRALSGGQPAAVAASLVVLSVTLLLLARSRMRSSYWWFATACIAAPLMTGTLLSMGRFLAVLWPVPLALALETEQLGRVKWLIVGTLFAVQLALVWMRASGSGPVV